MGPVPSVQRLHEYEWRHFSSRVESEPPFTQIDHRKVKVATYVGVVAIDGGGGIRLVVRWCLIGVNVGGVSAAIGVWCSGG